MENTQGSIAIEFRQGWGWLVLAALTISTIGDEITLLTLMFRTAESARAYGVPALLIAELLPGLIAAPWAGRLIDRRGAGRVLVVVSALQAAAIALIAYYPAFTLAGARSEEHKYELQSQMRITYAVFCLKQKTIKILQN